MNEASKLTREDWIKAALDALFERGEQAIRVEPLARQLNVTKGSFYWHFKDASELKKAALDGWRATQFDIVEGLRTAKHESAEARVNALIDFTISKDSRHDVGVRAWALINEEARAAVAAVDQTRLTYIESAFQKAGFKKDNAAQRARMLYYYQVGEYSSLVSDPGATRRRHAKLRARLLLENKPPA